MEYDAEARIVDYSNKGGMIHEEFMLPPNAPAWIRDLVADRSVAGAAEVFWNKVEAFEKRQDAQFAKEFIVALPVELTVVQNIALVRQFVLEHVSARGQVADWVYHDEPGNPHVHLMTSLRPLSESGFGPKKVALIADGGEVARNKAGKIIYKLWSGEKAEFLAQRQGWLDLQNQHLALAGLDIRVDGRSYATREIALVPTSHIGVAAKAMQRKADGTGRLAELERLTLFEAQREENARRIQQRPEIVLELITSEKSVFDERDVAKLLHRYVDDPETFQHLMARVLQSPSALRLERETIDFATGEAIRAKFTTRELIRIEAGMADGAMKLARATGFGVRADVLAGIFKRHAHLSLEQRVAIEHVVSRGRVAAVVGRAGAGKTTMMKAAHEVWESAGYRVVGGALAGKAAEGLEKEAGITSRTLSSWEIRWKQGRDLLDAKTVLVLDEAGMVASRQMATFVEAVSRAGAKLVLVGDPEQLQPIEAGAAFRAIADRIGYAELETIYRQKDRWMRLASLDLAQGRVERALSAYAGKNKVFGSDLKAQAIAHLIEDWNRDYDPQRSILILAHLRRDVRMLNELARAKLVERGLIAPGEPFRTEDGQRRFAGGDQIVFLKNDSGLAVKNGMIGKVIEAQAGRLVVEVGSGTDTKYVAVEQRFYRNLDHGYATTIHKSQGATVDQVKVLATLSLDRHLTYVAMTRHRNDLALYYGHRSFGLAGGLIPILSKHNAKQTTLDYERGTLYRQALRFAENRGLHLVRVARTLVHDRLEWALQQKQRLADLGQKLWALGARLTLIRDQSVANGHGIEEAAPMVGGIRVFPSSLSDAVEEKLLADPVLSKLWKDVSSRFGQVFADPQSAFRSVNFDAVLKDKDTAAETLERLERKPQSFGPLRGRIGLLAGKADRDARRLAERNVSALKLDVERYLRSREVRAQKLEVEETRLRQRAAIDIPALSPTAHLVLGKVLDAIERNDLPAALGFVLTDRMVKAEIDGFNKAIAGRFGDRALLANSAREPNGPAFEKAAQGLKPAEREKLAMAWSTMRAAQQLVAHRRSVEALKQSEVTRLSQRQHPVLK